MLSSQIEETQATLADLLTFEAQDGGEHSAAPNAELVRALARRARDAGEVEHESRREGVAPGLRRKVLRAKQLPELLVGKRGVATPVASAGHSPSSRPSTFVTKPPACSAATSLRTRSFTSALLP